MLSFTPRLQLETLFVLDEAGRIRHTREPNPTVGPAFAHFRGWTADELPERAPILGIAVDGQVVSLCFCARRSEVAAEAGVETAAEYRGRGLGSRITAAWARMIRQSGRLPLYSTSWTNASSLALAKRLGLSPCAVNWSVYKSG